MEGTCMVYPVTYFGEQFCSECDRCRVVRFFLRRTSSNRDLFRVKDTREVLRFEQHVVTCAHHVVQTQPTANIN